MLEGRLGSSKRAACSAPVTGSFDLIQETDLHEQRRLVPIDVLERDLAVLEANHHHERDQPPCAPSASPPARMAGISQSWVKLIMISSTTWDVADGAGDRVITVSFGQWPMNQVS